MKSLPHRDHRGNHLGNRLGNRFGDQLGNRGGNHRASAAKSLWQENFGFLRRFLLDERGSATVEFVMILPMHLSVLGLIFSVSMTLNSVSQVWDVMRDGARRLSTGEFSISETQTFVQNAIPASLAAVVIVDAPNARDVRVRVTITPSFTAFTIIDFFTPGSLAHSFTMRREVDTLKAG